MKNLFKANKTTASKTLFELFLHTLFFCRLITSIEAWIRCTIINIIFTICSIETISTFTSIHPNTIYTICIIFTFVLFTFINIYVTSITSKTICTTTIETVYIILKNNQLSSFDFMII